MSVHRASSTEESRRQMVSAFEKHVRSHLDGRLRALEMRCKQTAAIQAPVTKLIRDDAHAMAALREQVSLLEAERERMRDIGRLTSPRHPRNLSVTTQHGLTIGVPPYDVAWTSGPIAGKADAAAGMFECSTFDTLGYQAAGVGVFVSTTSSAELRFSADVPFHHVWLDWPLDPGTVTASEGGVGVLVYQGGTVVLDERPVLWSDSQSIPGHSNSRDDLTYLTQTPAGQTYFRAEAGQTSLVWVWAWVVSALTGGTGLATAHIDATMPFIVVEQM